MCLSVHLFLIRLPPLERLVSGEGLRRLCSLLNPKDLGWCQHTVTGQRPGAGGLSAEAAVTTVQLCPLHWQLTGRPTHLQAWGRPRSMNCQNAGIGQCPAWEPRCPAPGRGGHAPRRPSQQAEATGAACSTLTMETSIARTHESSPAAPQPLSGPKEVR